MVAQKISVVVHGRSPLQQRNAACLEGFIGAPSLEHDIAHGARHEFRLHQNTLEFMRGIRWP